MDVEQTSKFIADFVRFQKLHSWYKILPIGGVEFVVFLTKGQQAKNSIELSVVDTKGFHWHFLPVDPKSCAFRSREKPDLSLCRFTVTFGPFLRGIEGGLSHSSDGDTSSGSSSSSNSFEVRGDLEAIQNRGGGNAQVSSLERSSFEVSIDLGRTPHAPEPESPSSRMYTDLNSPDKVLDFKFRQSHFHGIETIAIYGDFEVWLAKNYPNINKQDILNDDQLLMTIVNKECFIYLIGALQAANSYVKTYGYKPIEIVKSFNR